MEQNERDLQIKVLTEMYVNNLENRLESLIFGLQCELENLRKNKEAGSQYTPNSCGIIQNQGVAIDELCIKIGLLRSL
jgi:hypothetical protein